MIVFACLSPHPPILLPTIGSVADRQKVKSTIATLESLAPKLAEAKPDIIIISSPHPDWGIEVPLFFLTEGVLSGTPLRWNPIDTSGSFGRKSPFKIKNYQSADNVTRRDQKSLLPTIVGIEQSNNLTIYPILTTSDSPRQHYEWGQKIAATIPQKLRFAWIASGDMSHVLKENGPYGFHPSGPKFDREFIQYLKKKDIHGILNMDPKLIEEAGVCGLWSFSMLFGALEREKIDWQPEILSYEGPFGVGYLVTNFELASQEDVLRS